MTREELRRFLANEVLPEMNTAFRDRVVTPQLLHEMNDYLQIRLRDFVPVTFDRSTVFVETGDEGPGSMRVTVRDSVLPVERVDRFGQQVPRTTWVEEPPCSFTIEL